MPPRPMVAIHVSELTRALEDLPAAGTQTPQPPGDPHSTGKQWFHSEWHYFVIYEALEEALRSDGTPFVTVSDAEIQSGALLQADGSPRYPILFSLASEAVGDGEIDPLRAYVQSGGYLFAGSSAFTRNLDGSARGDFALADGLGLHTASGTLENWYANQLFTKVTDQRLVAHIPSGALTWNMPLRADEVPWGTSYYGHPLHGLHLDYRVRAGDATVIAAGSRGPILTTHPYGKGVFIYHADLQPLLGYGGSDAGMYAYGIYRNAIEWAFEAAGLPLVRLSPWPYAYNAAFILRHDLENTAGQIIEASARAEAAAGAKGDYYFCTGVLRDQLKNAPSIVDSLRRAVEFYGATIGPHNGGLKNPNSVTLTYKNLDYWHWGPDEAIANPRAGYDYALQSVKLSYADIERWLDGLDNGRPGCGAVGDCPRIWVSPYFNSANEGSAQILEELGAVSMGEQKLSPFPHFTLSTASEGKLYPQVSLPVSEWYIGSKVAQSIESGHTVPTVRALVDFYYHMGTLVNLYGHASSASGLTNAYMLYSLSKERMWAANSVEIADWWKARSQATLIPAVSRNGAEVSIEAEVDGSVDAQTALDFALPGWGSGLVQDVEVQINGQPVSSERWRATESGIKVLAGNGKSQVVLRYTSSIGAVFAKTSLVYSGDLVFEPGTEPALSVRLQDESGAPVASRSIQFFMDASPVSSATTRENGEATLRLSFAPGAGRHRLVVEFAGDSLYSPSSTAGWLHINGRVGWSCLDPRSALRGILCQ